MNPLSGKPVVNCLAPFPVLQHQLGYRHSAGVTVTSARCAKAAMSVVSDISIRLWKIYGIKVVFFVRRVLFCQNVLLFCSALVYFVCVKRFFHHSCFR